ncbi:MAG: von Willebrand factor type A domain-containing protein [Bacteroidia bacterium]|nr:von Willebrand factor type A domain-containing protein [Bacteroidia bacterium]
MLKPVSGHGALIYCLIFNTQHYEKRSTKDNDFLSVRSRPVSTFSIDVDKASYALVKKCVYASEDVPKGMVRAEELINYFHYDYPQPGDEHPAPFDQQIRHPTANHILKRPAQTHAYTKFIPMIMKILFFTLPSISSLSPAAQSGGFEGRVSGAQGEVLPASRIALCDGDSLIQYTESDTSGHYAFRGLSPGIYTLECSAPYFVTVRSSTISVENKFTTLKDIQLFLPAGDLASALVVAEKGEIIPFRGCGGFVLIEGVKVRYTPLLSVSEKLDSIVNPPGTPADTDMAAPLPPFRTTDPRYFSTIRSY